MKSGRMEAVFAVLASAMLVLSAAWNAAAWSPERSQEIAGTWKVQVQLNNCSGTPIGAPFPSLLTFMDGGTMSEDTTNPAFAPGQRGSGHGVWEYDGHHTYEARFVAFIHFTTTPPPPPGFKAGTQTITQTIEFNNGPDQWTADAQIEFADTTGTVYRTGCATATAERLDV